MNRLNIGVQSFRDDALRFLGRIHNRAEAAAVIDQARAAGFDNLGLDLIYGLPGQTLSHWVSDLEQALRYRPEHLSCYILTFEPGTPMTRDLDQGRLAPLEESRVVDMFETTAAFLSGHGYDHYEISNFARTPDFRSRHNMKYWHFEPLPGFGPSAHSYRKKHTVMESGRSGHLLAAPGPGPAAGVRKRSSIPGATGAGGVVARSAVKRGIFYRGF